MESSERDTRPDGSIYISERGQAGLNRAATWGRALGLIGYITSALSIVMGLFLFAARDHFVQAEVSLPAPLLGGTYVIIGVLTFFVSRYLWQFAAKTELAIRTDDKELLAEGLHKLGLMMRLTGVSVIVSVVFFMLMVFSVTLFSLLRL